MAKRTSKVESILGVVPGGPKNRHDKRHAHKLLNELFGDRSYYLWQSQSETVSLGSGYLTATNSYYGDGADHDYRNAWIVSERKSNNPESGTVTYSVKIWRIAEGIAQAIYAGNKHDMAALMAVAPLVGKLEYITTICEE